LAIVSNCSVVALSSIVRCTSLLLSSNQWCHRPRGFANQRLGEGVRHVDRLNEDLLAGFTRNE